MAQIVSVCSHGGRVASMGLVQADSDDLVRPYAPQADQNPTLMAPPLRVVEGAFPVEPQALAGTPAAVRRHAMPVGRRRRSAVVLALLVLGAAAVVVLVETTEPSGGRSVARAVGVTGSSSPAPLLGTAVISAPPVARASQAPHMPVTTTAKAVVVTPRPAAGPAVLRAGDSGAAVADLQRRLFNQGFTYVAVTGVYDGNTTRGVTQLQQNRGITGDPAGVYGPHTRASLEGVSG
ncbi:peptidoglycan-binding domain-containing protein [Streptacidiphilus alkalitolerans]